MPLTHTTELPESAVSPDSQTWSSLLKKSNNLSEPYHLQQLINPVMCAEWQTLIFDVIRHICIQKKHDYGISLEVEGRQADHTYLVQHVYPYIPEYKDNGTQWIRRVFGKKRFKLSVSYSEMISQHLAEQLTTLVQPLIRHTGIPARGMYTTIFIGNEGFRPENIYPHPRESQVLYFHLGPGTRTISCLEDSPALPGQDDPDHDRQQSVSCTYLIKPGDVLCMPMTKQYSGEVQGLSIGVSVCLENQLVKGLMDDLKSDIHLALLSNSGWKGTPLPMEEISDFRVDQDFMQLKNREIQLPYPFKIYYKVPRQRQLLVFARGTKIVMRYHPLLPELIDWLNTHDVIPAKSLLIEINRKWPENAALYFLALLYNKRALRLV